MIARVADHGFWYGRYLERAESTARVLSVTNTLALDGELTARQCWQPVVIVSGVEEAFVKRHGDEALGDREVVQDFMTWEHENLSSLTRSIAAARENARSIREVVSLEVWESTNELHLWMQRDEAPGDFARDRFGFYRSVRQSTQLCLGLLRSTMLHDNALDFIWLGVMLERVGQTARLLDVQYHALTASFSAAAGADPIDDAVGPTSRYQVVGTALWLSLLRACSGFEPFLKRHQGKVSGPAVAQFLIGEPKFPRSVRYCVHAAYERLCAIRPESEGDLPGRESLARLRALDGELQQLDVQALAPSEMHALLTHVVDETSAIGATIGRELLGCG